MNMAAGRHRTGRQGFSVSEVLIALSVLIVVTVMGVSGVLHVMRSGVRQTLGMEVLDEGQRVAALLRRTARISRLGDMLFYASNGVPLALSYPVPGATNDNGDAVLDENGHAQWRETYVLHAWPQAEPTELRLTRFRQRDNSLTREARRDDLMRIAEDGHGTHVQGDAGSDTRVLCDFGPLIQVRTEGQSYDFYSESEQREAGVVLGGARLVPGTNTIRFQCTGKADASGGYGFRMDQLRLSPAGIPMEAEALFPVADQSGATATLLENVASGWSDRRALDFPAAESGAEMELVFYNDTWHETCFLGRGSHFDKCVARIKSEVGHVGTWLRPRGRDLAWSAAYQTGSSGSGATNTLIRGAAVRVVVRGGDAVEGKHILSEGDGCRITFRNSDQPNTALLIIDAFISEAANHALPGCDIDPSTTQRLHFGSPSQPRTWALLLDGETSQTVPLTFAIDPCKSYVISYRTYGGWWASWNTGWPWVWTRQEATNRVDTYVIPGSSAPSELDTRTAQWSARSDLQTHAAVLGVAEIETIYARQAIYTSRIVDTGLDEPDYETLDWVGVLPENTEIELRVRTGGQADLADAPEWDEVVVFTAPGTLPPACDGRYAQVQVTLRNDNVNDEPPELEHFSLRWRGEPAYVDVGGVFIRHPDGGQVRVLINDEEPGTSLRADVTVEGSAGDISSSWSMGIEITPRN